MNIAELFHDSKKLSRAVLWAMVALFLVALAFGGYYYWDRYIRLDDKSPLEISIEDLEEAVRSNPSDPAPRLALAETYLQNGLYDEAIAQAQQVLEVHPENERAMFTIGISYISMDRPESSIEPLEKFVAVRSESPLAVSDNVLETALYYLGESYIKVSRPADAIEVLSKALEINPTDADARYKLGLAYSQSSQPEKALEQYQEAVRFVPDFMEAYQGMFDCYTELNQPAYAAYSSGMASFARKDYQEARRTLEEVIADIPEYAPAHIGLGLVYEQLGDLVAAQASLLRALELEPDNLTATQALGRIQTKLEP